MTKKNNKFFMSRDRFGIKPFYYYIDEEIFLFASEIKAILKHLLVKTEPNVYYIKEYIKFSPKEYIKETAFKNIYRFDFASYFEGSIEDIFNGFKTKKFWELKVNTSDEEFDYIISSYSPSATHIIAHKLKLKFSNVVWIADFRDLWAYNHIHHAKGIFSIYEKYKERKILSNVDKIITVSEPLSNIMRKVYPDKEIYTIENGFDPDDFPNWEKNLKPFPKIGKKIIISYLGTIYPGKQDPSMLFEVCNELIEEGIINPQNIEINFYGDVKPLEDLINRKGYNRFKIIKLKGFVSRDKSLEIQKVSDLLLFLEWNDPTARGVLTGKLFEYLVSGTPILAVGISNLNEAGTVIEKTKTGKLYLEKSKLKKDLLKIFQKGYVDFYNPDIDEIRKFSREKQIKNLISIMENKC